MTEEHQSGVVHSISVLILALTTFTLSATLLIVTEARISLKWIDDLGTPLSHISVNGEFAGDVQTTITTDTNGISTFTGKTYCGELFFSAEPPGYYYSGGRYKLDGGTTNGRWQPWNPVVTVVVQRVVNPIPMYWKRVESEIPTTNMPVGFDLFLGDWVVPYGKGIQTDLLFSVDDRTVLSSTNFHTKLSVSIPGQGNGWASSSSTNAGSSFIGPYSAPLEGYSNSCQIIVGYSPKNGYFETNGIESLPFRLRSVTNEHGDVIETYYGKVSGKLDFSARTKQTGLVRFCYFLNPTANNHNLEADVKHLLAPRTP